MAVTTTDSTQQIPRSKKAPPPPEPFGFAKRIGFLLAFVKHFNVEKLAAGLSVESGDAMGYFCFLTKFYRSSFCFPNIKLLETKNLSQAVRYPLQRKINSAWHQNGIPIFFCDGGLQVFRNVGPETSNLQRQKMLTPRTFLEQENEETP